MGTRRLTMGIYNTYDPLKIREPHRRAVARAGALCAAFDLNLALFGFPFPPGDSTPTGIADLIAGGTTIGQGGEYLVELAERSRFQLFDFVSKGFPPQLGIPVATTSKPDADRKITALKVKDILKNERGVLLVVGLGPKGLTGEVKKICGYHLDITGQGYSLETCCAMGALAGYLRALLD